MSIHSVVQQACSLLPSSRIDSNTEDAFVECFQTDLPRAFTDFLGIPGIKIEGHAKQGNLADVPWIGIVPENADHETSPQKGVYLTILFRIDGSGFYVSIQHGSENGSLSVITSTSAQMRAYLSPVYLTETSIVLVPSPIDRFGERQYNRPKKYQAANVAAKFFNGQFLATELKDAIAEGIHLLARYGKQLMQVKEGGAVTTSRNNSPIDSKLTGTNYSPVSSGLLSKPFLILTGNSGTGKTRSAEDLAGMYRDADDPKLARNLALVAVGADWTDNRNVVGFVNHLRQADMQGGAEKQPVYQSTPVLDLLLAATEPGREGIPHFLILDEMNLSHVERYFADFLSAMEASNGVIRLHDEGPRDQADFRLPRFEGDTVGVPREIAYPQNLFVIGTVNVDETTYMFSPKVLDRAHVIEFEVDPAAVAEFLADPKPLAPVPRAEQEQAEAFLRLSLRARGLEQPALDDLPKHAKGEVNRILIDLLELLQKGRFEFAFRTAKEVIAYMRVCKELTGWEKEDAWKSDLDDEVLQKILPRLHGSRTRLGPLLGALGSYLHNPDKTEALNYFPKPGEELAAKTLQDVISKEPAAAQFPRSFGKVQRMARVLIEEQFASFIC